MTEWIVECGICRRPFILESDVMPWAGPQYLQVPAHPMKPDSIAPCLGVDVSGFGMGRKDKYEPKGKAKELLDKYPQLRP